MAHLCYTTSYFIASILLKTEVWVFGDQVSRPQKIRVLHVFYNLWQVGLPLWASVSSFLRGVLEVTVATISVVSMDQVLC